MSKPPTRPACRRKHQSCACSFPQLELQCDPTWVAVSAEHRDAYKGGKKAKDNCYHICLRIILPRSIQFTESRQPMAF